MDNASDYCQSFIHLARFLFTEIRWDRRFGVKESFLPEICLPSSVTGPGQPNVTSPLGLNPVKSG